MQAETCTVMSVLRSNDH